MAVGKGFQVEGLRFLKAKTPAEHMNLLPSNDMAMLCETQRSLSDRCSVSSLPAGGPTGESLVTAAGCLLGDLGSCSCYDNTEGIVFAFATWLTTSNSVFEFSEAPHYVAINAELSSDSSEKHLYQEGSVPLKSDISCSASALGLQRC